MSSSTFLLLNLAIAFYNAGTIWAHEVDIFRSWRLLDPQDFHRVQRTHWRKLPYWVFLPVALALAGSVVLVWFHPAAVSPTLLRAGVACQCASLVLTGMFWGPWQAKLSHDDLAADSPYLAKILSTHWIRTLLINAYALILLVCAMELWR